MLKYIAFIVIIVACGKDESVQLNINIDHVVQGEKLVFEDKFYSTASGHNYQVFRLKYYLSDFALEDDSGSKLIISKVHLVDMEDKESCGLSLGQVPLANYTKLSFILGLDEIINVEGGIENNMRNNSMEWPVIGEKGYHYMKFEGKYDSLQSGVKKNFNLHTGPTGGNKNYVSIMLDIPQATSNIKNLNWTLEMDIHNILHDPNDYNFVEFGQGIMSNQDAQQILMQNCKNIFRIVSIDRTW